MSNQKILNTKSNIILFLTDDHAHWSIGAYGNSEIQTPNLDHLASSGVVMERAYTPSPVCSPARACLLTGRIPSQHGLHDYLAFNESDEIDNHSWLENETLLPELLKKAGYETFLSGKWHAGKDPSRIRGFDHTFTIGDQYPFEHFGKRTFYMDGNPIEIEGYLTRIIADHAIGYLRDQHQDQPFYLQIGFLGTHNPWEGHPERLVEKYRNCSFIDLPDNENYPFGIQNLESTFDYRLNPRESRAQYYAAVHHIDEAIGMIIDELDSKQLRNDTLIIYTSDHGLNCGHHGIWGKGNGTLPLNMVEESIRVPLIFNHPGRIIRTQRRSEFVDHTDLFQTILEYSGLILNQDFRTERNYPGDSYTQLLQNEIHAHTWKQYQVCEYGDVRMIRNDRYKLIKRYPDGPDEFFDLLSDPRETNNLILKIEYQSNINRLVSELESYFDQYADKNNNGLNVKSLPLHNKTEAWRDPRNLH